MNYNECVETLRIPSLKALRTRQSLGLRRAKLDQSNSGVSLIEIADAKDTRLAGKDIVASYVEWQARYLAERIANNPRYRPARYVSVDVEPPGNIVRRALSQTPRDTQEMNMFSNAIRSLFEPHQHITGNALETLPFPDESITIINCIDSDLFEPQPTQYTDEEVENYKQTVLATLKDYYAKLVCGGKLIFFPLGIRSKDPRLQGAFESAYDDFLEYVHYGINTTDYHLATLLNWMSEYDRSAAIAATNIFNDDRVRYQALILTKPSESIMKAQKRIRNERRKHQMRSLTEGLRRLLKFKDWTG